MPVPGDRSVGVADVDRVPRLTIELAAHVGLAIFLQDDDAASGGHDNRLVIVHFAHAERRRGDVGALVIVAIGLVIGTRATRVIAYMVGISQIVIDEIGDCPRLALRMSGGVLQRPSQAAADGRGFGRDLRQTTHRVQFRDVRRDRALDARSLSQRDFVVGQR